MLARPRSFFRRGEGLEICLEPVADRFATDECGEQLPTCLRTVVCIHDASGRIRAINYTLSVSTHELGLLNGRAIDVTTHTLSRGCLN